MRRYPHRHHARLLLVLSLLTGATAHAQTKSAEAPLPSEPKEEADNKAAAEELFWRAKARYAGGLPLEAYEVYKAAWALRKTYEIAGNLANVALELGKAREAAEYFAYSAAMFPANGNPDKLTRLEAGFAEARSQVATVRVAVRRSDSANALGTADEAEVLGDGKPVARASLGREIYLEPGRYLLKVRLAGYADGEKEIQAEKGSVETIVVTLEPIKNPERRRGTTTEPAAPYAAPSPSPKWRLPVIVTGLGTAAVGLGLGIGSAVHSGARRSDMNATWERLYGAAGASACYGDEHRASCDDLFAADTDERTFRILSMAGFIVGGVGAAIGMTLFLSPDRSSPSGAPGHSAMAFSFGFAPGAGGALVRGAF